MRKYWLLIDFLLFISILILSGCSAQYHYKRILKKDPGFFKIDTTTRKLIAPKVSTSFDCNALIKSSHPKIIKLPRTYVDESGRTKTDSVVVKFIPVDSSAIRAEIDCPDPEIKEVPKPYPVYVNPTVWQKIKLGLAGGFSLAVLGIMAYFGIKIFKFAVSKF